MNRRPLPFVIASTPRSGTGYISKLLQLLEVPINHEDQMNSVEQEYYPENGCGTSSWLSVPFLPKLPRETLVLHQVRNPLRTINSLILTHNYHHGKGRDMGFLREHFQAKTNCPEAEFWREWHLLIEPFAVFRYQVERLPIKRILKLLGYERSDDEIAFALASVPTNFHTSGDVKQVLRWNDLLPEVRDLATAYGYTKDGSSVDDTQ
jgi:hypothetical protein